MWGVVLTLGLILAGSDATVTCRDNNNGIVDWYILYKAPVDSKLTGVEYIYINSNGATAMSPRISNSKGIDDPEGALANTLKPLFMPIRSMPANFGFISYNDHPPGCNAEKTFGHSKGVLMVDRTDSGVWLLHSTPQFPYRRNKNTFWPKSGKQNGQIFICVTFPYAEFKKIGKHLRYIRAFPFEHDIPEQFHDELKKAANWDFLPVNSAVQRLQSKAKMAFFSIAKQTSEQPKDGDLYVTIGRLIRGNVMAQTWGCQAGHDTSYCIKNFHQVINVETITTGLGQWPPTKDHSKWCVGTNLNNHVLLGIQGHLVEQVKVFKYLAIDVDAYLFFTEY
ncbi:Plancitoxin-1 [Takifugu flavidus]|uniref:Deoxyribonuclease-2-alpha n=1 Tax=Takifugu flavidus TaxID=433684 RepID=A0A5C6NIG8_9TELE|nr:Plancitoxin-1 [Takifugu flavidus]